jgi:hypothetical protein
MMCSGSLGSNVRGRAIICYFKNDYILFELEPIVGNVNINIRDFKILSHRAGLSNGFQSSGRRGSRPFFRNRIKSH